MRFFIMIFVVTASLTAQAEVGPLAFNYRQQAYLEQLD